MSVFDRVEALSGIVKQMVFRRAPVRSLCPGAGAIPKQIMHRGAICGAIANMVQHDFPFRVDQHVASSLADVSIGLFQLLSSIHRLRIHPQASGPPDIPQARSEHSVAVIQPTVLIHQQWPFQLRFFDVGSRQISGFEGDHRDRHTLCFEFFFMLSQLRQVGDARQSTQVTVEDKQ